MPPPRVTSYVLGTAEVRIVEAELRSGDFLLSILKENLLSAQERMKQLADLHRT